MSNSKSVMRSLSILLSAVLLTISCSAAENPVEKYQRIMSLVGRILEQGHFHPKKIDDAFSKEVFKDYIEKLDGNRSLFLASDISSLKQYETHIDDEIHGAPIDFFYKINELYLKNTKLAEQHCREILSTPFDFTTKETILYKNSKLEQPATEAARREIWYKQLKMMVLERYSDMMETQERSKAKEGFTKRTNEEIEVDAREKVRKIIEKNFARNQSPASEEQRFDILVNSVTNLMDPHTDFFPPIEKRAFDEQMRRKFYGIGAGLLEEDGKIKINSISTGGAAWKSGEIQPGDIIVKVGQGNTEPVDVTGYAIEDAIKLIRGDKDSEVSLTLKKADGTNKVVLMKRGELKLEESYAKSYIINGTHKLGYIYLPDFYADFQKPDGARCSKDVAKEILKLQSEKVDGIVLDIRDNGGGSLYEAVQMVGLFINSGPVVQVKDRLGNPSVLNTEENKMIYDGPLAVLVNEYSASASEIFAAAIQDYGRGVIVGSTSTYGKGTVQQPIPLENPAFFAQRDNNLGTIHLTLQKYYRINGGSTQLRGVTPDIILPGYLEFYKVREKDNPRSLDWDELQKLNYTKWKSGFDLAQLRLSSNQRVKALGVFDTLRKDAIWLAARNEMPLSLQLDQYTKDQKKVTETVQKVRQLMRMKDSLSVSLPMQNLAGADEKKNSDNADRFRNSISRDIYIGETTRVLDDMINMRKLAKN